MPLSNAIVARLKAKDTCGFDVCGLLLVTNWPASEALCARYAELRAALAAAKDWPAERAYLYPPSTLHCTVATLRAFTGGPLDSSDRESEAARWRAVLDAARAMPEWPAGASFRLRVGPPT